MDSQTAFERSHSIDIKAPAAAILDYVSNPNSWPEWIAASHQMDSPDRPLQVGDEFHEEWRTRKGGARLDWVVTECDRPHRWVAETRADFLGPIIVEYRCVEHDGHTTYTRLVRNPDRPKPPTEEMIRRIDEEADIALHNIKTNVEQRA